MTKSIITPFKSWWSFLLGNLAMGLIIALLFFRFEGTADRLMISTLWSTTIAISQWLGHSYIQGRIGRKYNWLHFPKQRFFWTVVSIVLYSVSAYAIVQVMMNWIFLGRMPSETLSTSLNFWLLPVTVSFVVSILIGSIGFFKNWKNAELIQEQLKVEMLNYKYEALKNQINPHFMFNSLNVLSELVHEDQDLAVKYIHKFSDMYRYVLESKDQDLRSLSEEIDFLEKYIFLLKIRFEDKLIVEMDVKVEDGELIVPVALQLLVENAVKHNEVSRNKPLTVKITKEKDCIVVVNKIQSKLSQEHSSKIGLKNLEQQYAFFTKEVEVDASNGLFTVKVPVLKTEKA